MSGITDVIPQSVKLSQEAILGNTSGTTRSTVLSFLILILLGNEKDSMQSHLYESIGCFVSAVFFLFLILLENEKDTIQSHLHLM